MVKFNSLSTSIHFYLSYDVILNIYYHFNNFQFNRTDYLNEYYEINKTSLAFWLMGRLCQLLGLIFLILHAASFQLFLEMEQAGMTLLTVGPILNMCGCSLFDTKLDPHFLFNRQWQSSETLELIGIGILDLSMLTWIDEWLVLTYELLGFIVLMLAAILDFDYSITESFTVSIRWSDRVHISDCFGLFLLCIVAILQYRLKSQKHAEDLEKESDKLKNNSNGSDKDESNNSNNNSGLHKTSSKKNQNSNNSNKKTPTKNKHNRE
jgi:hypothetical protein